MPGPPDPISSIVTGLLEQQAARLLGIAQDTKDGAVEPSRFAINTGVQEVLALLIDPTFGLAALHSQLGTLAATLAVDVANLVAQLNALSTSVGSPQQAGQPVTPWASFNTDVGNDVWLYTLDNPTGLGANQVMRSLYSLAVFQSLAGQIAFPYNKLFSFQWDVTQLRTGLSFFTTTPAVTWADVAPTDTIDTWLAKDTSGLVWSLDAYSNLYRGANDSPDNGFWFCLLTPQQFIIERDGLVVPRSGSPVWPGTAGVTLLASHGLTDGLVIAGPLQGVLVDITSVPTPISYYPFGTIKSYVRAGAVIFTDDHGESEFPQPLGPESAIVLPKSMSQAITATFRIPSGVVGTARGFTIP